ncbi:MAG: metallophosphoesterase [gamma proteobacterium symbiont of Bathyaustriella thionipta]|nr:metallophosphoesterase [gamma proteobacterium symbiont of Bathyaustriella thionipta]
MMTPDRTDDACRFIHLSDLHLSVPRNFRYRQLLNKRLLGYLSWLKSRRRKYQRFVLERLFAALDTARYDQILLTGDLTHIGLPDEFQQVLDWLQSIAKPDRIFLIAGNHDSYVREDWHKTYALWQDYMSSDTDTKTRDELFPSVRIRKNTAFIGLSTALPTAPLLASGTISAQQLAVLPGLLDKLARQGLFRVLMLHHPPVSGKRQWRKRLTNAAAFTRIVQQHGAELVLYGHTHRAHCHYMDVYDRAAPARIPVISAAAASATSPSAAKRATYNDFVVSRRADSWLLQFCENRYQPRSGQFKAQAQQSIKIAQPSSTGAPR